MSLVVRSITFRYIQPCSGRSPQMNSVYRVSKATFTYLTRRGHPTIVGTISHYVFRMTVCRWQTQTQRHLQTIPMMQSPPRTITTVFVMISHGYILRLIFLVYYRVYTCDGAIPSNSAAYLNDRYLGRISVEQMALPRTVKSLKRCIAAVEGIADHGRITLYTSATTEKTMDDQSPITLDSGPGLTPDEPITLVFKGSETICARSTSKSTMALLPPSKLKSPLKPRFCTSFA